MLFSAQKSQMLTFPNSQDSVNIFEWIKLVPT